MANQTKQSKTSKKTRRHPKPAAKTAAAKSGSKSDFVRAQPSLSAPELVALASQKGIKLTTSHVYNIRALDKKKRESQGGSGPSRVSATAPSLASSSDVESQFRSLVIRIGTDRSEQLLGEFRMSPGFSVASSQAARQTRRRSTTTAEPQSNAKPATMPPPAASQESASN